MGDAHELIVGPTVRRREAWVKRLGPQGYTVTSEDWSDVYRRMREAERRRGGAVSPCQGLSPTWKIIPEQFEGRPGPVDPQRGPRP